MEVQWERVIMAWLQYALQATVKFETKLRGVIKMLRVDMGSLNEQERTKT